MKRQQRHYPVIDLFAGPGGLGEGFSAFTGDDGRRPFNVALSIEKDPVARQTLLLRKFFRAFDSPPGDYFAYLAGRITRGELFRRFPLEYGAAAVQAWQAELGRTPLQTVTKRIKRSLEGRDRRWVLIGGPPCQAYSLVGRSRMKGTRPDFEKDERHFLYREYLRIVARHRPPLFLMENVKGLLSATHGGERIFQRILTDLRQPGHAIDIPGSRRLRYRLFSLAESAQKSLIDGNDALPEPESMVIRAEYHGIPQARHRIFILGVRSDLAVIPRPLQAAHRIDASSVLNDLPVLRSSLSREPDSFHSWIRVLEEVRGHPWFNQNGDSPAALAARTAVSRLAGLPGRTLEPGTQWAAYSGRPGRLGAWYRADCRGISNHEARGHMASDLHRYFFAACFAEANRRSPTLRDFPDELVPDHDNADQGRSGHMFADRFRVQLPDQPSTTITSHISKDGHYFIHYDPAQCRSLTVREAARLQTFPDNYHFEGPRTEQYHQVGNAVPPLLARQIAGLIHELLEQLPAE